MKTVEINGIPVEEDGNIAVAEKIVVNNGSVTGYTDGQVVWGLMGVKGEVKVKRDGVLVEPDKTEKQLLEGRLARLERRAKMNE